VTCESVRESAAVALLTREPLGPEEAEHLAGCDLCRAQVDVLAPLPGLLASAPADLEDLLTAPPPGDALLERLLAAVRRRRARRRRALVLSAAAAVVALVVVPLGVWLSVGRGAPAAIDTTVTNSATGVTGHVQLAAGDWGTTLTMDVSGVDRGTLCTIAVVTDTGGKQVAATWEAKDYGTAQVRGTVAAPLTQIARVDVVDDASGRVLVEVPVRT
jgi:hypothetical protein